MSEKEVANSTPAADATTTLDAIIKLYRETNARMRAASQGKRRGTMRAHEDLSCEALLFVCAVGRIIEERK